MTAANRHPLDWFFFLRPTLLFPVCTVFLAGYRFGEHSFSLSDWMVFVPSAIEMGGAVYVLNELFDVNSDKTNRKNHFIQLNIFTLRETKIYGAILAILGLTGLWWVAKSSIVWIIIGFAVTGLLYNLPPFRWKDKPTAGIAVAVLGGGLTFWSGTLLSHTNLRDTIHLIPYLFAFGGVSVLTQLLDVEGDRESGKLTLAVRYGVAAAGKIGWWSIAVAFVTAILVNDTMLAVASAMTAIVGYRLLRKSDAEWGALTARFAVLLLSLLIGVYFPVYLATIIVYYLFARWYYRMRFQINYPSITGTNW